MSNHNSSKLKSLSPQKSKLSNLIKINILGDETIPEKEKDSANNMVKDFMDTLFSDNNWTSIADDD